MSGKDYRENNREIQADTLTGCGGLTHGTIDG